jgi:hypothetical protein
MPATTDPEPARRDRAPRRSLGGRLAWFALLWLLGVAAVGALAYGIRLFLA